MTRSHMHSGFRILLISKELHVNAMWGMCVYYKPKLNSNLWASSSGHSGSLAGKGRRACNNVSGIWTSALKKLMWNADWRRWHKYICNDVITLGMSFSMFVYICARIHFVLIGGNLTAQSTGSLRGIGGGIQIPET